jgi:hypothetical protein
MSVAVRSFPLENTDEPLSLLTQICGIHKAVVQAQLEFSLLHEQVLRLEDLVFSYGSNAEQNAKFLEEVSPELISELNAAYRFWENTLERQFTLNLLQDKASLAEYHLYERVGELVRRELILISELWPQRILFIGAGALPLSAIQIHLQTGLPVDCLVETPAATDLAEQVLQKCKVNNSVHVFAEKDAKYDLSAYDLVIMASAARPKRKILRQLRKKCHAGCHILCRTVHGLGQLLYEPATDLDVRGFYVKQDQTAAAETISTWLLQAAGGAAADVQLRWPRGIDSRLGSQILRLMNRTLEEETTIGFPGPIDDETGNALMRQLHEDVKSGHRHVLIAEKNGMVVGQLILTPNSVPNHRHMVELTRGTIDRSFRGGGLALRAFAEIAKKCEELQREVICLDVRAGTLAAMWWQHFGFKPFGLLEDYSRVRDQRYQGLFLTQTAEELKARVQELAQKSSTAAASSTTAGQFAQVFAD